MVSLEGDQISAVTAYTDTSLFARFGLPESLDGMVRERFWSARIRRCDPYVVAG